MLKSISLLAVFLAVSISPVCADDPNEAKVYCLSEQIELADSTIFVRLGQATVEIDQLCVDQGGIYFQKEAMRCFNCRRPLNPKNTCECSPVD